MCCYTEISSIAEQLLSEAMELLFKALPETDTRVCQVLGGLGHAIKAQGRCTEAEPLVLESEERLRLIQQDSDG